MNEKTQNQTQEPQSEFISKMKKLADSLPEMITDKDTQGIILLYAEIIPEDKNKIYYNGRHVFLGKVINLAEILAQLINEPTFETIYEKAVKIAKAEQTADDLRKIVGVLSAKEKKG